MELSPLVLKMEAFGIVQLFEWGSLEKVLDYPTDI